jgi:anti-sigma factor (TIGR02949 family)
MADKHLHDDIGCMEAINTLYAYLDGELGDDVSIEQVEAHLKHCESCYSRADIERALTEYIRLAESRTAPGGVRKRLQKLLLDL